MLPPMPIETILSVCGNCGASLDIAAGAVTAKCVYCHRTTYLAAGVATVEDRVASGGSRSVAELARGPLAQRVGNARRREPTDAPAGGFVPDGRAAFPVRASASSTYGGAWSPDALLGAPTVFPSYGDRRGAWAPRDSRSHVEWIEVEFDAPVLASMVRVFETNVSGSVYAVVDRTEGDSILWAAPPESHGGARALDVEVSPPKRITRVRVYLTNPGGWSEIDSVALVTNEPHPSLRGVARPLPAVASTGARGGAGIAAGVVTVAMLAAGMAAFFAVRGDSESHRPPTGTNDIAWSQNATAWRGSNGSIVTVQCPPNGSLSTVWGTGPYTDDSSICSAGVHAGRIDMVRGGTFAIELQPGRSSYAASTAGGVTTRSYGSWSGSFIVR